MKRRKNMNRKARANVLTAAGGISGILAVISLLPSCCVQATIAALGILGGISVLVSPFSLVFLFLAVIFFSLAAYSYQKMPKKCQ